MKRDIHRQLAVLDEMTTGQLCERYADLFKHSTRTRHRLYLIRKIAWRLQAIAEGDLTERARRRATELADDADVRAMPPKAVTPPPRVHRVDSSRDPRLPPPDSVIVRKYRGETHRVMVLADGFEHDDKKYKSLSGVAKAITGTHCNGFRFFKLEVA